MHKIIQYCPGLLMVNYSFAQDKQNNRPQTPVPPFPYVADSLVYFG